MPLTPLLCSDLPAALAVFRAVFAAIFGLVGLFVFVAIGILRLVLLGIHNSESSNL